MGQAGDSVALQLRYKIMVLKTSAELNKAKHLGDDNIHHSIVGKPRSISQIKSRPSAFLRTDCSSKYHNCNISFPLFISVIIQL
jgi:hypothetical protein